jgi:hypothetical protein
MALASDFDPSFISKLLFIRALCASCGFNSGFRAKTSQRAGLVPFEGGDLFRVQKYFKNISLFALTFCRPNETLLAS